MVGSLTHTFSMTIICSGSGDDDYGVDDDDGDDAEFGLKKV